MSKKHSPVYLAGMPEARQPHEVWTRVGDQVWDQVGTSREARITRGRRETNPLVLDGSHERVYVAEVEPGDVLAWGERVLSVYRRGTRVTIRSEIGTYAYSHAGSTVLVRTSRAQSQVLRGTFHQGREVALYADVTSGTLADVERVIRSHAGPSVGAGYVSECAASIVSTGSGVLGWVTYTMDEPA